MMSKFKLLFIFTTYALIISAQESSKPKTNFKHILGLDVGYGSYGDKDHAPFSYIDYKGEVNLNYIITPVKHLFIKVQGGIAPTTNFGIITKCFVNIGFTTNMNKPLSWHLSMGYGYGESSKKYVITDGKAYREEYSLKISPLNNAFPFIETGVYIKPMKNKNQYIGINFSETFTNMLVNSYRQPYIIGGAVYVNVSYNIQLNKPRSAQ
jgi:hypothetical protein